MLRIAAGMIALLFLVFTPGQAAVAQNLDPHLFHTPWANKSSATRRSYRARSYSRRRADAERRSRVRSRSRVRTNSARIRRNLRRLERRETQRRDTRRNRTARRTSSGPDWEARKRDPENAPEVMSGGPKPRISPKRPATVRFAGYRPGEIVIDTAGRQLFYVLSRGRAYRYPIAVGRDGFQWFGTKRITRTAMWPDWHPPAEMRERSPHLPKRMTGGLYNPLGYKALYLGSSLYRIHGTPNTASIGSASSSGCFRMHNGHVEHLSRLAGVGTRVTVLRRLPRAVARSVQASLRNG
jgi:lipoprotein-anchoring transpeptidase ErfK/SrfK